MRGEGRTLMATFNDIETVLTTMTPEQIYQLVVEQNNELLFIKTDLMVGKDTAINLLKREISRLIHTQIDYNGSNENLLSPAQTENKKLKSQSIKLDVIYNKLKGELIQTEYKLVEANNRIRELELKLQSQQAEITAVKDTELKLNELQVDYDKLKYKPGANKIKGSTLSTKQKKDIIKAMGSGLSIYKIIKLYGVSRSSVEKIRDGTYQSTKTRQEIVSITNQLLRVNRNPTYIEKLTEIKEKNKA